MSLNKSIQAGMVVRLRSGGPLMTTAGESDSDSNVKCYWMSKDHTLQSAEFNELGLEIIDKPLDNEPNS